MFCEGYWFYTNLTSMLFYVFISSLTIFGNVLICVAFIRDPYHQLRTLQNYYIISLGVSDLLMGLATETLLIGTYWNNSEAVFRAHFCFAVISGVSSLLNMAAISIHRYFAVKMPLNFHDVMTKRRILISIAMIWIYTLHFAVLPLAGFVDSRYQIYLYGLGCFLPGMVICIAYAGIFKTIRAYTKTVVNGRNIGNTALKSAIVREKSTTKTMLIVLVVFLSFWIPLLLVDLIMVQFSLCRSFNFHVARDVTLTFTYFSSCVNPLLYAWRVIHFRRAFIRLLGLRKFMSRRNNPIVPLAIFRTQETKNGAGESRYYDD
ncbi:histamine H2 receptor-like [Montipora foliosa]|uniref:histamine H2 receptor-like n=1 Tax=Montipora foliosa TaxID=591990 RepID=UPI0035F114BF